MAGKSLGVPDNLKKKMCFCFFFKESNGRILLKEHRSQTKGVPNGQSWNSLSKRNNIIIELIKYISVSPAAAAAAKSLQSCPTLTP